MIFNISNPENPVTEKHCKNAEVAGRASLKLIRAEYAVQCSKEEWHKLGGLAYMIIAEGLKPAGLSEDYIDLSVDELQEVLIRNLIEDGYDFGEQGEEQQALIDSLRPPKIEHEYEQLLTIKIVVRRTSENRHSLNSLKEFTDDALPPHKAEIPGGSTNYIEMLKPDSGFEVVKTSVEKGDSGSGISYGWRKIKQ